MGGKLSSFLVFKEFILGICL